VPEWNTILRVKALDLRVPKNIKEPKWNNSYNQMHLDFTNLQEVEDQWFFSNQGILIRESFVCMSNKGHHG
jgi:hypothetical protein